jgi:hypothetical protein
MNIKEAKKEIKNAMSAYFTKDEFGSYAVPVDKQRPVFLVGAPGIGKTAIMAQIAHEIGVGLISYSITHHTRETMLGLPYASKKHYGEDVFEVSEYSMSEIIASIYEFMEQTELKEGMLLIDEINCVSESLSPVLLQFLQYKVFGKHRIPDGWIVVSAGNPVEYNDSVREFDIAILDRLRRFEVGEDYGVWKEFAIDHKVHPAVLSYLDLNKENFYKVGRDGKRASDKYVVTARSWDDLSTMLILYEQQNLLINQILIRQYLQHDQISVEFSDFYMMYNRQRTDYDVPRILQGHVTGQVVERARNADANERNALINLLLHHVFEVTGKITAKERVITQMVAFLRGVKERLMDNEVKAVDVVNQEIFDIQKRLKIASNFGNLSKKETRMLQGVIKILNAQVLKLYAKGTYDGREAYEIIKVDYESRVKKMLLSIKETKSNVDNILKFVEAAFGKGDESRIFVKEMMMNSECAHFINKHGTK